MSMVATLYMITTTDLYGAKTDTPPQKKKKTGAGSRGKGARAEFAN